jgi:rare lipoprotein A (peptidoglycan hydrolase)
MPRLPLVFLAALLTMASCAPGSEEEVGEEGAAQTDADAAPIAVGPATTTANLNLREEPSKTATIKTLMKRGSPVEVLEAEIKNGYVKVKFEDQEGWAFRTHLRSGTSTETTSAPTEKTGTCKASWYGPGYDGRTAANGEVFDQDAMTAARQLAYKNVFPFSPKGQPTVRVTNLANQKSVDVRITDTGPLREGRCLDLSKGAFAVISDHPPGSKDDPGVLDVKYEPVPETPVVANP